MIKTGFLTYAYINFMPRTKEEAYQSNTADLYHLFARDAYGQ